MYGPPQHSRPGPVPAPRTGMSRGLKIGLIAGGTLLALFAFFAILGAIVGPPPEKEAAVVTTSSSSAAVSASSTAPPARPAPSSAPAQSAPSVTPRPAAPVVAPTPTAAQRRAYLAALADIDPGLTVNEERVMRRAASICERIQNPPGGNLGLEQYVVLELSGGNATINEAQARQVIRAVKVWCR